MKRVICFIVFFDSDGGYPVAFSAYNGTDTGAVWSATGTLTELGVTKVTEEFGALASAGLELDYGCIDFASCPETTKVKRLAYLADGLIQHTYAQGTPGLPGDFVTPWTRLVGFMNRLQTCSSEGLHQGR